MCSALHCLEKFKYCNKFLFLYYNWLIDSDACTLCTESFIFYMASFKLSYKSIIHIQFSRNFVKKCFLVLAAFFSCLLALCEY